MRLVIDSLVALTLVAVLAGIAVHTHHEKQMDQRLELTRSEVRRFQSQVMLQAAMEKVPLTSHGYPATVDTAWFSGNIPVNSLLGGGRPLVDIADESQKDAEHPRDRMAIRRDTPQFWYNPYKGLIRARVPDNESEATALEMYNRVNDSSLTNLSNR